MRLRIQRGSDRDVNLVEPSVELCGHASSLCVRVPRPGLTPAIHYLPSIAMRCLGVWRDDAAMQTHHLTGPGELIATIPTMMGTTPCDAVVVVGIAGPGAVVAAMSADHVDLAIPEVARSLGESMAANLRANDAHRAIIVTFTDEDVTVGCPAVDALRPELESVVDIIDVWACDGERFVAPGCADGECCPPAGHQVPPSSIELPVLTSVSAVGHAAPAYDDDAAPPSRRRSAARAADRWSARRLVDTEGWRCESWTLCGESWAPAAPAPLIGRAIASLQDVRVRDAMIIEWLGGPPTAIVDTLLGHDSAEAKAVLDAAMRDPGTEPPVPAEMMSALQWCGRLIAHARRREQAPMYTLSAVALWWAGDSNAAMDSVRQALHRDPGYSLAVLVGDILEAGVSPAWQRA